MRASPHPARRLLFALLVAVGCGGSPTGATAQAGQFTADLSGLVNTRLTGFATSSGAASSGWTLTLITPGGEHNISMAFEGVARPDPGDYALVDITRSLVGAAPTPHIVAAVQLGPALLSNAGFNSLTGTLSVTTSTASSVEGTLTLSTFHTDRPQEVLEVTGTFRSTNR